MRKGLTVVLAGALLLAVASGASGATHRRGSRTEVVRLRRQVAKLKERLHAVTTTRDRWKAADAAEAASLRSSQEQLGAAQQQIASLQSQVSGLQGQVADLQSRLNGAPTQLASAIEQVRREVFWADGGAVSPPGQFVAQAAMDYTVGHVSTAAYGYLELVGAPLPPYAEDVNAILAGEAGICGHAARVYAAIVASFGFPVRSVDFSYVDPDGQLDGHVAVEVSYSGGWHFFDPTFGQFWADSNGDVLSIADVRAGLGTKQKDAASMTNIVEDAWLGDDTWFETDSSTSVEVGLTSLLS